MDFLSLFGSDALKSFVEQVFTGTFLLQCVIIFFICEALFKLPYLQKWESGKPMTSLILGALVGVLLVGFTIDAAFMGLLAGGVTTLGVNRLDKWFRPKVSVTNASNA